MTIETSTTQIEALQECKEIFSAMQEEYKERNSLIVTVNKLTLWKKKQFWMLLGGAVLAGGLILGIWGVGLGAVLALIVYSRVNNMVQVSSVRISQISKALELFYFSKELPIKLNFEYSDPYIIDHLIRILKEGKAASLDAAVVYFLSDHQTLDLTAKLNDTDSKYLAVSAFLIGLQRKI